MENEEMTQVMRVSVTDVGIFEDYESDEVLEVGIAGIDEAGSTRSFSIQRCTYGPDEQDIAGGMDSYNISTERGITVYGCLKRVEFDGALLTMNFSAEDAEIFEIQPTVEARFDVADFDPASFSNMLRMILDWGNPDKRPLLVGV